MKKDKILIATDGSAGAREALEAGLGLARGSSASAIIVYVRPAPLPILGDPFFQRALTEELRKAHAALADAEAAAEQAGVEVETEILEGDTAERVLDLARSRDVDVIVVGSRGRGAVVGALLGSVSAELVHKADRPVLVAKERARAQRRAA